MTIPSIPSLTAKGEQWAAGALLFLLLLGAAYLSGSCHGAQQAADHADSLHAQSLHDSLTVLERQLPALQAKAAKVDSLAALTVKPHEAAKVQTDTMGAHEASARATLEAVLADSLAKLADVRQAALDLAASDSLARLAVLKERDAANARILALNNQHQADSTLLAKDAQTIQLSTKAYAALQQVNKDLKAQQPNGIHRAVKGIVVGASTVACAALGSLFSPAGALIGGAACAGLSGVLVP